MKYGMRMLSAHRRQLCDLLQGTEKEQACFLLCSIAQGDGEELLLVNEVIPLSSDDLAVHRFDQLSVAPMAMLRVARRAQNTSMAVCMVHTHPMSDGAVEFSYADDVGNERSFSFFHRIAPGLRHSALVWDGRLECCAGRVYHSGQQWSAIESVSVVNAEFLTVHRPAKQSVDRRSVATSFDRQARLLGVAGQKAIETKRLVVVGSGGVGSVATIVAAHSGMQHLHVIDPDHADKTSAPRLLGALPSDLEGEVPKVTALKRYLDTHFVDIQVTSNPTVVEDPANLPYLASADAIICCTDDTTSRAYLNQVCNQYFVPVLDLGVQFQADPDDGKLVKEVGRVNLVLPGLACMYCSQQINPKVLHDEGLTPAQRSLQAEYIIGTDVPEPSMMIFNMEVVAKGMQLLMFWLTGLVPVNTEQYERIHFLGLGGARGVRPVRKHQQPECPYCACASPILGKGSATPMWIRPRPRMVA